MRCGRRMALFPRSSFTFQGADSPVQCIAQVMEHGGLQSQRDSTDMQVNDVATRAPVEFGDESAGQ